MKIQCLLQKFTLCCIAQDMRMLHVKMFISDAVQEVIQNKNREFAGHVQLKLPWIPEIPGRSLYYSLSPGFWQSFISIEVCRDCIPALASSCKKQLTGFFVCLLFFLKVKRIS